MWGCSFSILCFTNFFCSSLMPSSDTVTVERSGQSLAVTAVACNRAMLFSKDGSGRGGYISLSNAISPAESSLFLGMAGAPFKSSESN